MQPPIHIKTYPDGYRWEGDIASGTAILVPASGKCHTTMYGDVFPFFVEFGQLKPTAKNFLEFANKSGNLREGSDLAFWHTEHAAMHAAVAGLFQFREDIQRRKIPPEHYALSGPSLTPVHRGALRAHKELTRAIERLKISVVYGHRITRGAEGKEASVITYKPALVLEPKDFIGFMWEQLEGVLSTNKEIKTCDACRSYFYQKARGPKGSRYCSDACRGRAFQARKRSKAE